ncbi:MAG: restriction endonuclease subunit S [Psychroflexus halocasei]
MKKYPAYKDSGVDWLGEIPEHWETKRSKFLWFETTNLSEDGNEQLLSVSQYDGVKTNKNQSRSENLIGYKKVCKDNLVTNIMLAWLGGLGISNFDGVVSPAYSIYQASNEILPRFAHYLYRTKIYLDEFARRSSGVVPSRWRMYTDDFGEVRTVLPPKPEQEAIAHFLDDTCEKLDKVVAQKEKMIALLKERKQALIQKAVTRGLDENVDFKDSGVDWIGDIPVGWEVKRLKHLTTKIGSGVTPSGGGTTYLSKGIPLLRSQNILFDKIELSNVAYISKKIHNSMSNSKVYKGDVLLNITGGSLGRCYFHMGENEMNVNQHVCILRPSLKVTTVYLNALIASEIGQKQIWFFQQGGGREGLNFASLKNFLFPVPEIKEQNKISKYIQTQSKKIDQAVSQQEQAIVKLREYKASLIDSCVLGKIKVT